MSIVEDMRSVEPFEYIRAVGLQPEDCYGFLPLDMGGSSYFFLYRDRPEYEEPRVKLPGPEINDPMDPLGMMGGTGGESMDVDVADASLLPGQGGEGGLADVIAQAQQMQQDWAQAVPGIQGAPAAEPDKAKIERIEKLKESGAINETEYARLLIEAGGDPGAAPLSKPAGAPDDAANLVMQRMYPGMRMRSSNRQLNHFGPRYRDELSLCPEDVYGVFPRTTRTSHTAGDSGGSSTEWDDFWVVYRDRPEYEAGRAAWAKEMNKKGKWPEAEITPGVASPSSVPFDKAKIKVEKDRWPRQAMVMRKKGTDLGDALREKISKWGYEPEDSFGFAPDFDNSAIYFAWAKR